MFVVIGNMRPYKYVTSKMQQRNAEVIKIQCAHLRSTKRSEADKMHSSPVNFVVVFNSVLNIYWSCSWACLQFVLVIAGCFSSSKNYIIL